MTDSSSTTKTSEIKLGSTIAVKPIRTTHGTQLLSPTGTRLWQASQGWRWSRVGMQESRMRTEQADESET